MTDCAYHVRDTAVVQYTPTLQRRDRETKKRRYREASIRVQRDTTYLLADSRPWHGFGCVGGAPARSLYTLRVNGHIFANMHTAYLAVGSRRRHGGLVGGGGHVTRLCFYSFCVIGRRDPLRQTTLSRRYVF
jgi:hypothetical protein